MPKKKTKKEPTLKQRNTFKAMVENGGKLSTAKAMRKGGYSEAMARNPSRLTESDGWQTLLHGIGLTDEQLARKGKEHLEAATLEQFTFDGNLDDDEIKSIFAEIPGMKVLFIRYVTSGRGKKKYISMKTVFVRVPQYVVQDKALDKFLRIRGGYKNEANTAPGVAVQVNNILQQTKDRYKI